MSALYFLNLLCVIGLNYDGVAMGSRVEVLEAEAIQRRIDWMNKVMFYCRTEDAKLGTLADLGGQSHESTQNGIASYSLPRLSPQ